MLSQRKTHSRSVSSLAMGLNTLTVTPALTARSVNSWAPVARGESARPRRPSRSFSAESLHTIPQTLDIESQFQAVLGKSLFDKAVQIAEEEVEPSRGSPTRPFSASPGSSRPASSYGSSGANSPLLDERTTLRLRPTRCTSPLVKGTQSFDSYINKGSIDQLAVAKTRGAIESPKPSIYRYLRRVKTASDQNLNDFSLKAEFTDKMRECDREQYWRRKKEQQIIEEETRERKRQEKAEMMIILEDMKKEYEETKAKEALEFQRLQELEAERIAKEKLEAELALAAKEAQANADDMSVVSSSSKSSKKRSSKKGKGKRDKTSRKAKSARKSSKKKSSMAPSPSDADGEGSGSNTPQPILKSDERRPSDDGSGETGQGKRVTFREKLVSTRTIKPHKPVSSRKASPKKPFPGSSSSEARSSSPTPGERRKKPGSSKAKRGKKGTKKKTVDSPPPVQPLPEPEPTVPVPPPPEPVVEPEPEEPKEPEVIIVEEPPEFCPAAEYKTRKQLVEEWLYYRSSSAASHANPPIL